MERCKVYLIVPKVTSYSRRPIFRILARTPAVLDFLFVFLDILTSMLGVWATSNEANVFTPHYQFDIH